MIRVGLISDTHGLLRPAAQAFLHGCQAIVHAGDVGGPGILEALGGVAPVTAVRGNNDVGTWAEALPRSAILEIGAIAVLVIHEIALLEVEPAAAGIAVVVCGHSHRPSISERAGVLYVNPGSAGPRRFKLPIAVGELRIEGRATTATIHTL